MAGGSPAAAGHSFVASYVFEFHVSMPWEGVCPSAGIVSLNVVPDGRHSEMSRMNGHRDTRPGQSSVSSGMKAHRVLSKPMVKPYRSEKTFALRRSAPEPPALKA